MGTRINPCFGCPLRKGCQQREMFRKRARKIGARVISFDCPILAQRVRNGVRVVIRAHKLVPDHYGYPFLSPVEVRATITAVKPGHKFACTVDGGQGVDEAYRFRRFQAHTRILEFLSGEWLVCDLGNVQTPGDVCDAKHGCACRGEFNIPATLPDAVAGF